MHDTSPTPTTTPHDVSTQPQHPKQRMTRPWHLHTTHDTSRPLRSTGPPPPPTASHANGHQHLTTDAKHFPGTHQHISRRVTCRPHSLPPQRVATSIHVSNNGRWHHPHPSTG